ncbi:predicted protein [Chaetomium globosum CBS 148.51]|uniref:Uncharacterized protein n=1 Tax=Chaetomium globosum (strain ATCC 6205 / CBS 148.51 / DSM 1962 / NBRC 6347 / NRRL 1970) TaxID=306901 RepID=Q2HCQ8_CHAGB|nr:uncharacterized protein CHGG_01996 [Chaetomium globosum CBS 148.51]EAQ93761.1 predicted protein [Chaetomium globosum CBS 148.51]
MVLPECFVDIPALPNIVSLSGTPVAALLAYAPTHTDYVGGTSCGLSSYVTTTPYTPYQRTSIATCSLPSSVSGKPYSVTPVVFITRTVSSTTRRTLYSCDPIPAASINKGNFDFACKSLLGKDVGAGIHSISWYLPTAAGISIWPYTFDVILPKSTPTYVINTALATTTLVPTTEVYVDATTSITRTVASTSTVTVPTATSTCFVTVTVTQVPGPRLRRTGVDANLKPDPASTVPDSAIVDADDNVGNSADAIVGLEQRASARPKIGKPDFTYPPYGVTTIYVTNMSTDIYTYLYVSTFYETAPDVTTTTTSCLVTTTSTITVTATPVSR